MRGGGGYNQDSSVYFAKGSGGWVFTGINGVGCVDVEGRAVFSDGWDIPGERASSLFIAEIEMAMGCRGVCWEEGGVKCGCMQGCCEGARPGVRSWRRKVQVAVITKTNRVGAAVRQS